MSLFFYYAWHSFINQVKKLFRTWVAIVILCCLGAGLVTGMIAAFIGSTIDDRFDDGNDTSEVIDDDNDDDDTDEDDGVAFSYEDADGNMQDIGVKEMIDLIAMALASLFVILFVMMSDKTNIFLPADTVLLFTSPMKPQKVLLFRICCNLGAVLAGTIWFSFQLPSILMSVGGGWPIAISILLTYIFILSESVLLQSASFMFQAGDKKKQFLVRLITYIVLGLTAAGFIYYVKSNNISNMGAGAVLFFTNPITRYIPLVGWTKAILSYTLEGNYLMAGIFVVANILLIIVSIFGISKMKADYYEPAMARAEEYAQILESQKSSRMGFGSKQRTKDRSDRLMRNELNKGNGANAFFFKEMYNRKRFSLFGIFTKTFGVYAVFAIAITVILVFKGINTLIPAAGFIAAIAFFRTLGNPLSKDTELHYFSLIPEKASKKLFYSLLGGLTNTALDTFIPLLVCAILSKASPLEFIAFYVFILSLDCFATTVSAFIAASTPNSTAKPIRQVMSVLFMEFGIVPSAVILVICGIYGYLPLGLLIASVLNFGSGAGAFALLPIFLG